MRLSKKDGARMLCRKLHRPKKLGDFRRVGAGKGFFVVKWCEGTEQGVFEMDVAVHILAVLLGMADRGRFFCGRRGWICRAKAVFIF